MRRASASVSFSRRRGGAIGANAQTQLGTAEKHTTSFASTHSGIRRGARDVAMPRNNCPRPFSRIARVHDVAKRQPNGSAPCTKENIAQMRCRNEIHALFSFEPLGRLMEAAARCCCSSVADVLAWTPSHGATAVAGAESRPNRGPRLVLAWTPCWQTATSCRRQRPRRRRNPRRRRDPRLPRSHSTKGNAPDRCAALCTSAVARPHQIDVASERNGGGGEGERQCLGRRRAINNTAAAQLSATRRLRALHER